MLANRDPTRTYSEKIQQSKKNIVVKELHGYIDEDGYFTQIVEDSDETIRIQEED